MELLPQHPARDEDALGYLSGLCACVCLLPARNVVDPAPGQVADAPCVHAMEFLAVV